MHNPGKFEAAGVLALPPIYFGFYLPVSLYIANQAFIQTPGARVIGLSLVATFVWMALLFGLVSLAGSRTRHALAGFSLSVFAIAFAHDLLPLGTDQTLDGTQLKFDISRSQEVASFVLSIVLAYVAVHSYIKFSAVRRAAHLWCTALSIAFLAMPLLRVALGEPLRTPAPTEVLADVVDLSSERNILLILMDSMQTDVVEDILETNATLRDRLRGFVLFADNLGVASTTYLTMPAMLAGAVYDGRSPVDDFFEKHIVSNSVLTDLARRRWDVTHVNPMLHLCESEIAACASSKRILLSGWPTARLDYLKLLDIGLLNAAPYPMKNLVYNRGEYVISVVLGSGPDRAFLSESVRFLRMFTAGLKLGSRQPTIKLVHLMNTHPPFALDSECSQHDETRDPADYREQLVCGLRLFADLLDRLDELGVGEKTAVVLLSDTGVTGDHKQAHLRADATSASESEAKLMGNASPTLLVRRQGNHAPYTVSEAQASVVDIPATICQLAGGCTADYGSSVFDREPGETHRRRFVSYVWNNDSWSQKHLSEVDLHDINGPGYRSESWSLVERIVGDDEP